MPHDALPVAINVLAVRARVARRIRHEAADDCRRTAKVIVLILDDGKLIVVCSDLGVVGRVQRALESRPSIISRLFHQVHFFASLLTDVCTKEA